MPQGLQFIRQLNLIKIAIPVGVILAVGGVAAADPHHSLGLWSGPEGAPFSLPSGGGSLFFAAPSGEAAHHRLPPSAPISTAARKAEAHRGSAGEFDPLLSFQKPQSSGGSFFSPISAPRENGETLASRTLSFSTPVGPAPSGSPDGGSGAASGAPAYPRSVTGNSFSQPGSAASLVLVASGGQDGISASFPWYGGYSSGEWEGGGTSETGGGYFGFGIYGTQAAPEPSSFWMGAVGAVLFSLLVLIRRQLPGVGR